MDKNKTRKSIRIKIISMGNAETGKVSQTTFKRHSIPLSKFDRFIGHKIKKCKFKTGKFFMKNSLSSIVG
jgi:hypothetical protein